MTSSIAGSLLLPVASYSISMPFALTRAMSPPLCNLMLPLAPTGRPPQHDRLLPGGQRSSEQARRQQDRQRCGIDLGPPGACLGEKFGAFWPLAHQSGGGNSARGAAAGLVGDAQDRKLQDRKSTRL